MSHCLCNLNLNISNMTLLPLLLLLLFHISTPEELEDTCQCIADAGFIRCPHKAETDLEVQCSTDPELEELLVMHIKPSQEVQIDCPDNMSIFSMAHLPNITIENTRNIIIRFCPSPGEPFKEITSRFAMKDITSLEFSSGSVINFNPNHFKGLENLTELILGNNGLTFLEPNLFTSVPNLVILDLRNNQIELEGDVFSRVPKLKFLDLSENKLGNIPPRVFQSLQYLTFLHLCSNELVNLDRSVFKGLENLHSLELSSNRIENISSDTFKDLTNLFQINLSRNKLKILPNDLFRSNKNLRVVRMKHNRLEPAEDFFTNLNLEEIDLANCHLKVLPARIFENTTTLKIVHLENNRLGVLPESLFEGLVRIESLYLQNNKIGTISSRVFGDLVALREINLKSNRISSIDFRMFGNNANLETLNLAYNNISDLQSIGDSTPHLKLLDLSHNRIASLDLKYLKSVRNASIKLNNNRIRCVNFADIDEETSVTISHNPIECDCRSYDLVKYFEGRRRRNVIASSLKCAGPPELENKSVFSLPKHLLTCPLNYQLACSSLWRPFDKSIVIDCSGRNLTKFPVIDLGRIDFVFYNQTEVLLDGNSLVTWPDDMDGFDNVTKLVLSKNKIRDVKWLPPKLEVLKLDHNHLTNLSPEILNKLNTSNLRNLTLDNNPWICNCDSATLTHFLLRSNLSTSIDIFCAGTNRRLIDLKQSDLCHISLIQYFVLVLSVLLTLLIFFIVVYHYQRRIKIWLFARNIHLWFASEETLDKEKMYDAFISYSHKDEDFVVQKLLPFLENGPRPYKLCLHYRNWIPGELISTQITNSVLQSRRTLIVLSKNFVESVWGKMEFLTAHAQTMRDGRARVVVVLLGDVDVDGLDENLQMYLKTNTYVKWGDPYFYSKLKQALPQKKRSVRRVRNMVDFMGDRSRLVPSEPSSPGGSSYVSSNLGLDKIDPFSYTYSRRRHFEQMNLFEFLIQQKSIGNTPN